MIKLQGLNKFFNKGKQNEIHVINNIDLTLPERGMVAIFGKSGCGKTTLLNVIGGLDKFGSGSVSIQEQDIRQDTDVIRNRYMGYIFQNYNLNKTESCFDNVANALRLCGMKDPAEIENRVKAALSNVGMEKYSLRTPDTLSGGQQQRIAIARAIVKNPRIILADEPTGNLDENNTVMIMDLLKAISKDHLVLLVTHEANLVDYYCDTVIELSDGKVVKVRNNESTNGYTVKDKNDIYLGELEKTRLADDKAEIEYYGDAPETPFKLKIVNNGGKLYVQIETPKVQVLDASSEVKLREGVYTHGSDSKREERAIDMSKLPPVDGSHFGKLFSLKSSIKSGYATNFRKRKKGKVVLRGCMILFAMVIVFMSAVFGTVIQDIINAKNAYNHNVFYLYVPNGAMSAKVSDAVGKADTGIDYARMMYGYPYGDMTAAFQMGAFETFSMDGYRSDFNTNAVFMDNSMASELPLVEGKKENLSDYDLIITTKVADALIAKSTLGHIREYKDLIGLISNMFTIDGKNLHISGVVKSNEAVIYLSKLAIAKYVGYAASTYAYNAHDFGMEVAPGEAVLVVKASEGSQENLPKVGEKIKIHGRDITVTKIIRLYDQYEPWLEANGIKKQENQVSYFRDLIQKEHPDVNVEYPEFQKLVDQAMSERWYEYYHYYYQEFDAYLQEYKLLEPDNFLVWLAVEKNIEYAKFHFMQNKVYYQAAVYKELYGKYPTMDELNNAANKLPSLEENLEPYSRMYEHEFYNTNHNRMGDICSYLVSEQDYIAFSKGIGETHPTALVPGVDYSGTGMQNQSHTDNTYRTMTYMMIHSNNPRTTKEWLESEFADLETGAYFPALVTPDDVYNDLIWEKTEQILAGLGAMIVVLVVMSICMYFIMRSSLMNRIKEVGIYRAIGVSKKNLVFKFLIEAVVLTTLTVFVGYVLTSCFIYTCFGLTPLMSSVFYYPPWMALAILVLLYVLCLICGTLPILSLLHKTPSEILAKYDI